MRDYRSYKHATFFQIPACRKRQLVKEDPLDIIRPIFAVCCLIGLVFFCVSLFKTEEHKQDLAASVTLPPSATKRRPPNNDTNVQSSVQGAEVGSTARTNSPPTPSEERLLAAIPQLKWSQDKFVSEGWMGPRQKLQARGNGFSKDRVMLFGIEGKVSFIFDNRQMFECTFKIREGTVGETVGDADFASLYNVVKEICSSPEIRKGDSEDSSVKWTITGANKTYAVELYREVLRGKIERGVQITIAPLQRHG